MSKPNPTRATRDAVESLAPVEARMAREVRLAINAVARQAAKALLTHPMTAAADWTPPDPSTLADQPGFVKRVTNRMSTLHTQAVEVVFGAIITDADLSIGFDVANPLIERAVAQVNRTKLADDVWAEIRGSLQASHDAGLSIPHAAKAMVKDVGAFGETRAEMIARTEMISASNGASLAAVTIGELADTKVWLATEDGRTRDTHAEADGQEVALDEAFQVGGDELQYPGDPSGSPEETVNCRCTVIYNQNGVSTESGGEGGDAAPPPEATVAAAIYEPPVGTGTMSATELKGAQAMTPQMSITRWEILPPVAGAAGGERRWQGVLCIEGIPTGDGRYMEVGSLGWRDLPLSLFAQFSIEAGHDGAVLAGRIDTIERVPMGMTVELRGTGAWLDTPEGHAAADAVESGAMTGVSVDLEVLEFVFNVQAMDDAETVTTDDNGDVVEVTVNADAAVFRVVDGLIMGATLVGYPAFRDAYIAPVDGGIIAAIADTTVPSMRLIQPFTDCRPVVAAAAPAQTYTSCIVCLEPNPPEAQALAVDGGMPPEDMHVTLAFISDQELAGADLVQLQAACALVAGGHDAMQGSVATSCLLGDSACYLLDTQGLAAMRTHLVEALTAGGVGYSAEHDFIPHMSYASEGQPGMAADATPNHGTPMAFSSIVIRNGSQPKMGMPMRPMPEPAAPHAARDVALTASAPRAEVPAAWFELAEADAPSPIHVTAEGQVYGHVAAWGDCHIGSPGTCVAPPESHSEYRFFHLGVIDATGNDGASDVEIEVGQITLGTGHADLRLNGKAAAAHYDDTGWAVADVRASDGEHGIWICGALREVPDDVVRELRAAKVSGDWRKLNGHLEMVGVLAVNVPGFPRPRANARVASADIQALIAAGIVADAPEVDGLAELDDVLANIEADDALDALDVDAEPLGGAPSKGTKKDRRLRRNQSAPGEPV